MFEVQMNNEVFQRMIQDELSKSAVHGVVLPYLMDSQSACNYLSISRPTLNALMKSYEIEEYKVGRKYLYRREDIEKLADTLCERSKAKNYDLLEA